MTTYPKQILHLSTVHIAEDVRILYRECASLAQNGYKVTLMAVCKASFSRLGVQVLPLRHYRSRFARLVIGSTVAMIKCAMRPEKIIHFHDPEFIPFALMLRLLGKTIIYDIHENLHEGLYDKKWIPFKRIILPFFFYIERLSIKRFHLILAESSYSRYYEQSQNVIQVLNFPDHETLKRFRTVVRPRQCRLFYIGGVTRARGIEVILQALNILKNRQIDFHFDCIGPLEERLASSSEFQNLLDPIRDSVTFHGRLSLEQGYEISKNSSIGLCILQPIQNYLESYPTKLFEYMVVGLPFIYSNFQLYVDTFAPHGVGIPVNPSNPEELARAIEHSTRVDHKDQIVRGITASETYFNWKNEEKKILELYDTLTAIPSK